MDTRKRNPPQNGLTKLPVLPNLLGKRRPLVGGNLRWKLGLRTIPATDPFRGEELIAASRRGAERPGRQRDRGFLLGAGRASLGDKEPGSEQRSARAGRVRGGNAARLR